MTNEGNSRPYFHHAISQLREEYESASTDSARELIVQELNQRQSTNARDLLNQIRSGSVARNTKPSSSKLGPPLKSKAESSTAKPKMEPASEDDSHTNLGRIKLTKEQYHAVELFQNRRNLRINAFAGTGKTTTLLAMAQGRKENGVYLAFNRAIADDAKRKFPRQVRCQTVHSLAYVFARDQLKREDKLTNSINTNLILQLLPIKDFSCNDIRFSKSEIANCIANTLRQFFYSQDYDISTQHFRTVGFLNFIRQDELRSLTETILESARSLWYRMIDPNDPLPLGHDGYLKYWALCRPRIEADYILMDEAQDTNPVVLEVIRQQLSQIVLVGDRHQQIYEWRGAVNAMDFANADQDAYLTESFRFGADIANIANRILRRLSESRSIIGAGGMALSNDITKAMISRTNGTLIESLIERLNDGEKPYLEGGTGDLKRLLNGIRQLTFGKPSELPELFGFRNWNAFVAFANTDQGSEYRSITRLIGRYSVEKLLAAIDRSEQSAKTATITLSTTHKAKGREWDDVSLTDDFKRPSHDVTGKEISNLQEELRICYVAVTRARLTLSIPDSVRSWI